MSQPMMAAGFVAAFLDYAVEQGAPRGALLAACGLGDHDLADQDNRVPVAAYQALIAAATNATGDTAILLRHTLNSRLEMMSVVGQIVHSSASLPHSIEQLNRYLHLMAESDALAGRDRFELLQDRGEVWIVDHLPVQGPEYIGLEASFARFISEFRRSFPDQVFALEMEVTYPPPPHVAEYPDLFRIPVRFNASRNALRIDPVWLTEHTEFEPGNAYAFGVFTRHADALLSKLKRSDTIRDRIEAQMLPDLHQGSLSMDKIARDLGMSRQTLYRRLKDEGVTFAQIHDDLRHRMACDYLTARKVSVNETAYLLGFSEASSFVRAFRRWTGQSPSAYRNGTA
ncbi:AraC family transcriptional regulator ligand-binding domain-containing protein [Mesobacterium sp. TK19101]|uniref:AraC family transcriptional regulator ligand-binding domain-containing protein n=1 Tax=Mesobacterium hydrothermale TaxID=3111907 RepID=A0ABU6HL35_9RHOB|nr:AraC family transcriptional regulator ligand-binding domain-containing protein [Mesobacterium sp. TK19101]MEC3863163.1 AraC family transcriptional regulator ligand-binding domain-containing protein [Mesobacterium sp. TK19101]